MILIIVNFTIIALDRYPIRQEETEKLDFANEIIFWFFFAELVIKVIGLGPKGYIMDKFNLFDCFVVILSTIEISFGYA